MEHSAEGANDEGFAAEVEPLPHKRRHVQHDASGAQRQQLQLQQTIGTCDEPPEEVASEPCVIKARPLHSILDSISRRKGRPASYFKSRLSRDGSTESDVWGGTFGGVTEVGAVAVDPSLAANGVAVDLPCATGGGLFADEADSGFGSATSHAFVDVPPSMPTSANGWSRSSLHEQQPLREKASCHVSTAPASSAAFPRAVVAAAAVTPRDPSHVLRAGSAFQASAGATAAAAAVPASVTAAAARRHAFSADLTGSDALPVHMITDRHQPKQEQQEPPLQERQQDGSSAGTEQAPNGQQQPLPGVGNSSEPMLFTCEHCGVQLPRARDLNRHMLSHTRMHVCNHCGHRSSSAYNLRVHIRTHTGERPHACSECGQTFTQTCSLKRHALMHAAERVQTCRVCHKQFLPGLPLSKHMLKHIGEKTFICEACDSLEAPPPPTPQARARAARASAAARRQSAAAAAAAASSASASLDGFTAASQTPSPPASRAGADASGGGSCASTVP